MRCLRSREGLPRMLLAGNLRPRSGSGPVACAGWTSSTRTPMASLGWTKLTSEPAVPAPGLVVEQRGPRAPAASRRPLRRPRRCRRPAGCPRRCAPGTCRSGESGAQRGQQLDAGARVADGEHRLAHALLLVDLLVHRAHVEGVAGRRRWRRRGRGRPDRRGRCGSASGYRDTPGAAGSTQACHRRFAVMAGSVIVAGARTPMGRLLGSLKDFSGRRPRRGRHQGRARARPGSRPTRSTT